MRAVNPFSGVHSRRSGSRSSGPTSRSLAVETQEMTSQTGLSGWSQNAGKSCDLNFLKSNFAAFHSTGHFV